MTEPHTPIRAIALLHGGHDPAVYEALTRKHRLKIVYTVHTDTAAVLAALIAVQHAFEHVADAVMIPHLDTLEPGSPWWVVTEAADLITSTQHCPRWSAVTAETKRQQ
ncbi:hypothetical protein ACFXNW_16435 [Nocardia sp. NPDC059180]|uniref:hypothetical protein n=1 Tax=Nocardia sp. NPDC059180 TaxID=3346761 RepID=UPI0036C970DD